MVNFCEVIYTGRRVGVRLNAIIHIRQQSNTRTCIVQPQYGGRVGIGATHAQ